ncbi:hypothetical protein QBC46DRAFT_352382 [Diplogelasinospora grovesii]|uniref:VPS9 domain-containing protein n=1 Tax=Diplogelasinospora grovesii TaxID=303347 RepID=A0AAN6NAX7_9PEZI|nr:hypothetical protein QBC46DRAFT_352382 [Diplogelasinospora grovesii]
MASTPKNSANRPSPLRTAKSFPREPPQSSAPAPDSTRPKRASTMQNGSPSTKTKATQRTVTETKGEDGETTDTFESRISEEGMEEPRASVDLDDLPIELISLTDSFIDQLSAKVHPTPPNIDNTSRRFQDFYATAAQHIQTHIDSVATRRKREGSPAPSNSPRASAASLLRAKAASLGSSKEKSKAAPPVRRDSDQQMLTAEEYADRKKARKILEQKRVLYEEAVERRLCEGIYSKIYRHRSTQDEAQDDKLRSKTAALDVVGISPVDLGVEIGASTDPEDAAKKQKEVRNWLEQARKELVLMNQSRYPLGKLNHLKAAHKSIIDTLSHFHPSSSADELMPMLIYTLITLPPANLNVISDLHFIQRFRWEPKIVGEAAYCLTNLEAAISFLETVDLSTLRADEAPTGPLKGPDQQEATTKTETFPPAYSGPELSSTTPPPQPGTAESAASLGAGLKSTPSPAGLRAQLRNRRLSDLVNTPAQAFNAASDAVFNTADQGLKTIGISLGDSYKFLIGRLREHPEALPTGKGGEILVPKTLDDARKLIGTTPPPAGLNLEDEGSSVASGASSVHSPDEPAVPVPPGARRSVTPRGRLEDRILTVVGGSRKVSRDHSAESGGGGGKSSSSLLGGDGVHVDDQNANVKGKTTSTTGAANTTTAAAAAASGTTNTAPAAAARGEPALMDSVRNLGNSLNPMARLSAGIGGFRGFGRTPPPAPPAKDKDKDNNNNKSSSSKEILQPKKDHQVPVPAVAVSEGGVDLATAFPDIAAALPPKEIPKINPPVKRFMELENPADLRLGEVLELLRDYRRLAGALKEREAFKE